MKLCFLDFHVISPNATKYTNKLNEKKFYKAKQKQYFGDKVPNYKDGRRLEFINFEFVKGGQEIKVSIPLEL